LFCVYRFVVFRVFGGIFLVSVLGEVFIFGGFGVFKE